MGKIDKPLKSAFYAVRNSKISSVFKSWDEARPHIEGIRNVSFKKFPSFEEATAFLEQGGSSSSHLFQRSKNQEWLPNLPLSFRNSVSSLWIFTDGSCPVNANVAQNISKAGWGVVVLKCSDLNDSVESSTILDSFCGSVETNPQSPEFCGAEYG